MPGHGKSASQWLKNLGNAHSVISAPFKKGHRPRWLNQ